MVIVAEQGECGSFHCHAWCWRVSYCVVTDVCLTSVDGGGLSDMDGCCLSNMDGGAL